MLFERFAFAVGIAIGVAAALVGCGDDSVGHSPDAIDDFVESGTRDTASREDELDEDSGQNSDTKDASREAKDADSTTTDADAGLVGFVTDLVAMAETARRVEIRWTAPAGDIWAYDLRYAKTPITTDAEFLAATPVPAPVPLAPGSPQTMMVDDLTAEEHYHFAVRVELTAGGFVLSNDAETTTKRRAKLLISEVAPSNTAAEGDDFVELVAVEGGSAAEIDVITGFGAAPLHKFGALDVAAGDRIVIHVGALPGPTGFAQEDATNNRASSTAANASPEAFDVYSATSGLVSLYGIVAIEDGETIMDAVAYSNRTVEMSDGQWSAAMYQAVISWYLMMLQPTGWIFSHDLNFEDLCPLLFDLVNSSGDETPTCGGPSGHLVAGSSMQRNGLVDTDTLNDFFVGPQTPGRHPAASASPNSSP